MTPLSLFFSPITRPFPVKVKTLCPLKMNPNRSVSLRLNQHVFILKPFLLLAIGNTTITSKDLDFVLR